MDALVQCELVATGRLVWLPHDSAEKFAALGRVRLPKPAPDQRYAEPSVLPLEQTWRGGRFWPTAQASQGAFAHEPGGGVKP